MNQPLNEKETLTLKEASAYFSISVWHLRRIAKENIGTLSERRGRQYFIIRAKFEEHLLHCTRI